MAQIVTAQPGTTVVVQQTQVLRDWNSGLFSCFDDIGSCIMGWCCPCFLLCSISSRMQEGFAYGCCCSEIAPFTLRAKLRTEQHIQGSLCNDALTLMFCLECSLCQMDRELKAVGKWRSKLRLLYAVCDLCRILVSFFSLLTKKFFEVLEQKSLDFLLVGVSLILFLIEYGIYSRHDCHC